MPALPSYIVRRKGSRNYYVRMPIPKDLQERLGTPGKPRRERWLSLNTGDPTRARQAARPIIEKWEREFRELRHPKELTEAELQDAIWKRYIELISADEKLRLSLPTDDDTKKLWAHIEAEFGGVWDLGAFRGLEALQNTYVDDQRERVTRLAKLKTEVAKGETKSVSDVVEQLVEQRRLTVDAGSPEYRKVAHGIQRAEIEALQRAAERDRGDWSGEPKDKLVRPPVLVSHPPGQKSLSCLIAFGAKRQAEFRPMDGNRTEKLLFGSTSLLVATLMSLSLTATTSALGRVSSLNGQGV